MINLFLLLFFISLLVTVMSNKLREEGTVLSSNMLYKYSLVLSFVSFSVSTLKTNIFIGSLDFLGKNNANTLLSSFELVLATLCFSMFYMVFRCLYFNTVLSYDRFIELKNILDFSNETCVEVSNDEESVENKFYIVAIILLAIVLLSASSFYINVEEFSNISVKIFLLASFILNILLSHKIKGYILKNGLDKVKVINIKERYSE